MKFITDTKELKNLLELHKKVNAGNNIISTLNGIAFKAIDDNTLQISSTNLETTVISVVNVLIETPGSFIVPFKTLQNIISCNDDTNTCFELIETKKMIKNSRHPEIKTIDENGKEYVKIDFDNEIITETEKTEYQCKIDKMKVNCFDVNEYPELPPINFEKSRILNKLNFTDFISSSNKIIKFVSTEEGRQILTGVLFDTANKCLVGTDSYRLGKSFYCFNKDVGKFVVPGSVIKLLANIYKQFKTEIFNIILEDNQITFKIANITVITRLLSGKYPEYEMLIPQDFSYQYKINSKELIKCIDKAKKLFVDDVPIKINFNTVKADITASLKEVGSYEDLIKVNTIKNNNDEFLIAFNPIYLKEGIESFEDFNFYANDPLKQAVIKNDDDFLFMIMPIRTEY